MVVGEEIIAAARYLFSLLSLASLAAQELAAASGKWRFAPQVAIFRRMASVGVLILFLPVSSNS
jgi:hypothetical protein